MQGRARRRPEGRRQQHERPISQGVAEIRPALLYHSTPRAEHECPNRSPHRGNIAQRPLPRHAVCHRARQFTLLSKNGEVVDEARTSHIENVRHPRWSETVRMFAEVGKGGESNMPLPVPSGYHPPHFGEVIIWRHPFSMCCVTMCRGGCTSLRPSLAHASTSRSC